MYSKCELCGSSGGRGEKLASSHLYAVLCPQCSKDYQVALSNVTSAHAQDFRTAFEGPTLQLKTEQDREQLIKEWAVDWMVQRKNQLLVSR